MKRIMIDIEAIGNGPATACIVQLGACFLDGSNQFKRTIDPRDAERNGARAEADTVMWWLAQSEAARISISAPGVPERQAFEEFNTYLENADEIWSHATYDFVLVTEAMKRLRIKPKFSYRAARDIRTLMALAPVEFGERAGIHHDALDDAIFQAKYCSAALASMGAATEALEKFARLPNPMGEAAREVLAKIRGVSGKQCGKGL